MAKSDFTLAFNEITDTHRLPRDVVIDALRQALVSAYRRDAKVSQAQRVEAEVDPATNQYRVLVEKEVTDSVMEPMTEVSLEDALKLYPQCAMGDLVMMPQEQISATFGRVAAQTAKQVILQKIREAERRTTLDEFKAKAGDIVIAMVQSVNNETRSVTLQYGRAELTMPGQHRIPNENLRPQSRVQVFVVEVRDSTRGPQIIVSRTHRDMLKRMMEIEIPEIYNGHVEIKSVAREPGQRSKVAVVARQAGLDPVGACIGDRGRRIQEIVQELGGERIDVVEWSPDPARFIEKALSPAKSIKGVYLEEDIDHGNTATVIVAEEQLSLAIGKSGQNARLAARLTGWRIDIKGVVEASTVAIEELESNEALAKLRRETDLVVEVKRILEKKRANRMVMPEEYDTLGRFANMAERQLLEWRDKERTQRRRLLEKVRDKTPQHAFTMPLEELELEEETMKALRQRGVENVGELMARLLAEPQMLHAALESITVTVRTTNAEGKRVEERHKINPDDELQAIQDAIESLVISTGDSEEVVASAQEELEATDIEPVEAEPEADAPPAFVDAEGEKTSRAPVRAAARPERFVTPPARPAAAADDDKEGDRSGKKKGKKGKNRQLEYDESRGEVVVKRSHKRKSGRFDWEDYGEDQ
jgi:transcription termination/antitermination protein NusA